jgi:hypothetical protein
MKTIQIDWKLPLEGTIIDFETTHWDSKMGELVTSGFLTKDGFKIIQRYNSDNKAFKKATIKEMESLPKPWYAFNKKFEEDFCGLEMTCDLQNGRESAYRALKDSGLLDHYNLLCDPLFNNEVPTFWNLWKKTKEPLLLSKIVRHNFCCLSKEYYLKLLRVDNLSLEEIKPLFNSAQMEKMYFYETFSCVR